MHLSDEDLIARGRGLAAQEPTPENQYALRQMWQETQLRDTQNQLGKVKALPAPQRFEPSPNLEDERVHEPTTAGPVEMGQIHVPEPVQDGQKLLPPPSIKAGPPLDTMEAGGVIYRARAPGAQGDPSAYTNDEALRATREMMARAARAARAASAARAARAAKNAAKAEPAAPEPEQVIPQPTQDQIDFATAHAGNTPFEQAPGLSPDEMAALPNVMEQRQSPQRQSPQLQTTRWTASGPPRMASSCPSRPGR